MASLGASIDPPVILSKRLFPMLLFRSGPVLMGFHHAFVMEASMSFGQVEGFGGGFLE